MSTLPSPPVWSRLNVSPASLRIDVTLNCGQSFRWVKTGDNEWTSVVKDKLFTLRQTDDDVLFRTYCPDITEPEARLILHDYFRLNVDLETLYEAWKKDVNFKKKAGSFGGIRMLRLDPVESTFSFICTSNNNIQRITMMIEKLCERYGSPVGSVDGSRTFYSFPRIPCFTKEGVEAELRALGFGYRAKYIVQSAKYIMDNHDEQWLEGLRLLPYQQVKAELLKLSGVGPKVADCICLTGMDKLGAIPVDTHVWQIAKRDYKMSGLTTKTLSTKNYDAIGDRFREIFGEHAGWAHSILFTADLRQFGDRLKASVSVSEIETKTEVTFGNTTISTTQTTTLTTSTSGSHRSISEDKFETGQDGTVQGTLDFLPRRKLPRIQRRGKAKVEEEVGGSTEDGSRRKRLRSSASDFVGKK
ncbi:8-oxoguanine glycosylase ogg1 [Borealophlyctis nickersoniae]|nr:8-oxoguanine glycosylase ogg1 [Borealophlyctis nickersoniae]